MKNIKHSQSVSKERNDKVLNLLLITQGEIQLYVVMKGFNNFMYNSTKHEQKKYFCMHCLQSFTSEDILIKHKSTCMEVNGDQSINMPSPENSILKFQNYHKQLQAPFIIYADFESILEKIPGCQPNNTQSFTEKYQEHVDCGYRYKVVCCYGDKYSKPVTFVRGKHAVCYLYSFRTC